jgi:hypothetical protein
MTETNKNHADTQACTHVDMPAGTNIDTRQSNDSFEPLVSDISNNLTTKLTEMISQLLDTAQNNLFNMSNEADSNEDQARYFELMNQIRTLKAGIAQDFISNIDTYLAPAIETGNKDLHQNTDEDELSLVDQDTMEAIVLVKGIGERAAAKYQETLSQLDIRLQHLAQKTDKAFKADAIKPINICQAFDDALANDFSTTDKKTLFSMFDTDIANDLGDIYETMNDSLIDGDILPQIKHSVAISQVTSSADTESTASNQARDSQQDSPPASPPTQTQSESSNSNNGGNNISGFAMTAQPGSSSPQVNQNAVASENNSHTAATQDNTSDSSGNQHPGSYYGDRPVSNSGEFQHQTAGIPASQVGKVLGNYLGTPFNAETVNNSADNTANNAAIYPQSSAQHFGHQEILQALSSIQSLPEFNQPDGTRFDGEAVKQAIISSIAKSSGGAVTKGINQIAEKTIDFIELIFDAIIEDREISDTIKTLLLRLQIPIIKASMSDQEFFIYDDHPARELLDTIADVGVGITDHTDETYIYLDQLISGILSEYELSTEIFKDALDGLKAYIEEKDAVTREREEEEQRLLLRKHARATILKSLRAATTGKILPETTHPLILKRWPTLMFNHYLANGKENDEWINIVLTLRRIVDSVQPINSAEQLAKVLREKEALFEITEKYLNISSNSKKDVHNIMAVYKETINLHIDDANFSDEEVSTADKTIANSVTETETSLEEDTNTQAIPPNIMPGMWFQIYMGEDKTPRRCKLSVILIEDAKLMFANHKGELIVEKTFDEFNEEVANETTLVIMGHSAFEHAFKTVINHLD